MSRLTRDGTAEPVSRDQIIRRERGQGNIKFPCSADHEQDWQPYPYSTICDDHTSILHTYRHTQTYYVSSDVFGRSIIDNSGAYNYLQDKTANMITVEGRGEERIP